MALSADGHWLAAVSTEGGAETGLGQLWSLASGPASTHSMQLTGHAGRIQAMAISPGNRWLALGVDDAVKLWDLTARDPAAASVERQCRHGRVTAALFTGDGKWLVTCGDAREPAIRLWNLTSNDPSDSLLLDELDGPIRAAAVSADSKYLVAAGNDQQLRVWNLTSIQADSTPVVLTAGDAQLTNVAMSAAGDWLAASDANGKIYLWRVTGSGVEQPPVVLAASDKSINALAFTPDGRWLAAAGADWTARLWNLNIGDLATAADKLANAQIETARLAARQPSLQESLLALAPSDIAEATLPGVLWSTIRLHAPRVQAGWKPWLLQQLTLPEEPKIATGPRPNEVGELAPPAIEEPAMPAAEPVLEKPSLMVAMPEADPAPSRPAVPHEWPVRSIVTRSGPAEAEPRTAAKPASTLEIHTR
jgi:WD40 repeat protein